MIISSFRFRSLSCNGRTRTTTLMLSPGEVGEVDPCDREVMLSMLPFLWRIQTEREGKLNGIIISYSRFFHFI